MTESDPVHYAAAGGVVVEGGRVLVLRRPGRNELRLPKGHIHPGEVPVAAALREVCEEAGYCSLVVLSDLGVQRVEFDYRGQRVVRDEHYFLLRLDGGTRVAGAESQFKPVWLSWSHAEDALTFEAEREWIRRAHRAQRANRSSARVQVALSTGSLYTYGLARVFKIASRLGYDGIEVLVDGRWDTRHPDYLRSLALTHGIPIASLHSPFVSHVGGWPDDELGRLQQTVSLARDLGVPVVVAHLPLAFSRFVSNWYGRRPRRSSLLVPRLRSGAYERFLLDTQSRPADIDGIRVCVENMPATRVASIRINAFRLNTLNRLSTLPNLTLDTTHLGTWGMDPLAVYERLRPGVAHIHLSNYDSASGVGHRSPLEGDIDLSAFLQRLVRDKYSGCVVLEGNPSTLGASDPVRCEHSLRRALAFCRRNLVDPKGNR